MDLSQDIKLIALDLDGTLFNSQSVISKENIKAIKAASDAGVNIVISTGRPFCGDPFEQISGSGIDYSINANGSSAYRISTGECLFEDPLDDDVVIPVIEYLLTQRVHMDAFIKGQGYSPVKCLKDAKELSMPPSLHKYIMNTRKRVDSLVDLIKTEGHVLVITIMQCPESNVVCLECDTEEEVYRLIRKMDCEITFAQPFHWRHSGQSVWRGRKADFFL